jgi:hypothetical protein
MTLPGNVLIRHLDKGIATIVKDLNRIPGIHTLTTCEGHIWREVKLWPTKDGWVHFSPEEGGMHQELIEKIDSFCLGKGYFRLKRPNEYAISVRFLVHSIFGMFEPHHDEEGNDLFELMGVEEQEAYFRRAEIRKEELQSGWKELDMLVRDYIGDYVCSSLSCLPYRYQEFFNAEVR